MPRVFLPDGRAVNFPDTMSPEDIKKAMAKLSGQAPAPIVSEPTTLRPVLGRGTKYGQPNAPVTNAEGAGRVWPLSPIPAVSKAAQALANRVEGVNRPIYEPGSFNIRGNLLARKGSLTPKLDVIENVGHLGAGLTGVPSIAEASKEAYQLFESRNAVMEHPMEALRGGAAGILEGLGNLTPVDYLTGLLGLRARLRAGRPSPGSPAELARTQGGSGPPRPAPRVTVAPEGAPDIAGHPPSRGSRIIRGEAPVDTAESRLAQAVVEAVAEGKRKVNEAVSLPPDEAPNMPNTRSRKSAKGPAIEDPARNVGDDRGYYVREDGTRVPLERVNVEAELLRRQRERAAREEAEGGEGKAKPLPPKKAKLPETPRSKRPESPISKLEKLDENSTIKEVAEAVNAVARKEPEVLAKRDPKLEALAAEMEAKPTVSNREVNKALLGETVRGSNRKPSPTKPGERGYMDPKEVGEGNAAEWNSYEDVPGVKDFETWRQKFEEAGDKIAAADKNPDYVLTAEDQKLWKEKGWREFSRKRGFTEDQIKENDAWQRLSKMGSKYEWIKDGEYNPPKVAKPVEHAATVEEANAARLERRAAPTAMPADAIRRRSTDFSPEAQRERMLELAKDPEAVKGMQRMMAKKESIDATRKLSPPREVTAHEQAAAKFEESAAANQGSTKPGAPPAAAAPQTLAEANAGKTVKPLPAMKPPKIGKPAPVGEAPVIKVAAAETKPVAKIERDLTTLSPSERVKLTSLEKQMPQSVKSAVEAGSKLPKLSGEMASKVADYRSLVDKTKGKGPVESRGAAAEVVRTPATLHPSAQGKFIYRGRELEMAEVQKLADDAGAKLPAVIRKSIDEGKGLAGMKPDDVMPHMDAVMEYSGWRERIRETKQIQARNAEIDRAAGRPVVEESRRVAAEIGVPKPEKVPEIPAKVIDAAVEEAIANGASGKAKIQIRPYLTDTDIGPPPRGVDKKVWRTINAVEREGARMLKSRGWIDPRFVDRMRRFWGSDEAARRLGMDKNLLTEISGKPHKQKPLNQLLREMDEDATRRYEFLRDDPKGFIRNEALLAGAGVAAGGLVGAAIGGESVEDRLASAVSLALLTGAAGFGAGRMASRPAPRTVSPKMGRAAKVKGTIEELDSANLLLGPAVIKASLGSIGGVADMVWQRLREGKVSQAKAGINFMVKEAPGLWFNTLRRQIVSGKPEQIGQLSTGIQKQTGGLSSKVLNRVLAPFVASDTAGRAALKRMGVSEPEALRSMMNGEPTSYQGQLILKAISSAFSLRMLAKFARVKINIIERGIEHTPGLNRIINTRSAHNAEKLTKQQLRAKAEIGAAAIVAGSIYGYLRDPNPAEAGIASSMAGPAALPAAAAIAAGKGFRRGGVSRAFQEAGKEALDSAPQMADTTIRDLARIFKGEIPDRFKPLRPLRRALGYE